MRKLLSILIPLACLFMVVVPASAQQQFQGICAKIKVEIAQELALERVGFEATLEITNNDAEDPITDLSAALSFENPRLSTNGTIDDASSLFFVRTPELESIASVDGSGIIMPGQTAVIRWFIIPKPSAGGSSVFGIRYLVGCALSAKIRGEKIPEDQLFAISDTIDVKPEPLLDIAYFQPRDVQGDDTFTETVETPVPFTLGVMVKNVGYGMARDVLIHSEQPRIVENNQQLLIVARLLGARVMDSPLDYTSLTVNIGDLMPGQAKKAAWDMITSLSGEFLEFNASYTHAPELGGEETSIITNLAAYFMIHEVLSDLAGRDNIKDFLADVDEDGDLIADTLYESDGNVYPVNHLSGASAGSWSGPGSPLEVDAYANVSGWGYIRIADPAASALPLESVVRDDGKIINSNNCWVSYRYDKSNTKLSYLHIFDLVDIGSNVYTVTYVADPTDTNPPVTAIEFAGNVVETNGEYHIDPDTQMFFLSSDENPVSVYYSITNGPLQPGLPFTLDDDGTYTVDFFGEDSYSNVEATQTVTVVIDGLAPEIDALGLSESEMQLVGDALTVRADSTEISFGAAVSAISVDARIDIFQGVMGWVTVSNVPSSPTTDDSASLVVSGNNVDFYKYKLDAGSWSADTAVSTPITLSSLSYTGHVVEVLGRSQYGAYPSESLAVDVSWRVTTDAPPTRITGTPATPSSSDSATLQVSGAGVTSYVWTVNAGYWHPEELIATDIALTGLATGDYSVAVRGRVGGIQQDSNVLTTVSWSVDPQYGCDMSALDLVKSQTYSDIGTNTVTFEWDGSDVSGHAVVPGWYTVRLLLTDGLAHTSFATCLVLVEEIEPQFEALVLPSRGANSPYGRGRWLVWYDQSDGSDEIYAWDMLSTNPSIWQLTDGELNQHNPRTDGRYAVWQGRQIDGTWDIYFMDLTGTGLVQQLTSSEGVDEVNPAIDWPWVVYQRKSAANPSAPWLLKAYNLITTAESDVSVSSQDQMNPDIQQGRVVWQDWRNVGPGEIYYKDLEASNEWRITSSIYGQYYPVIYNEWIVWQDSRHGQTELYAYNLIKGEEVRLTTSAENETKPYMQGDWVMCLEDSLGQGKENLRLVHVASHAVVPLTRSETAKSWQSMPGRNIAWLDESGSSNAIMSASLPGLQAMFETQNAVPVTPSMVSNAVDSYTLLEKWNTEAQVSEIVRFASLAPTVVMNKTYWNVSAPAGDNFALVEGEFVWVKFDGQAVIDLGLTTTDAIDLPSGISALSCTRFPQPFSAHKMIRQLGLSNVQSVRMLEAKSGRWMTAEVRNGAIVGYDFDIPSSAVLLINMNQPVNNWYPE